MDLKIINIFRLVLLEFFFGSTIVFVASPLPPSLPSTHQKRGGGGGGGIIEGELLNKARFAFFLTKQHQLL